MALNVYATAVIVRSPRYERRKKWWQFGLDLGETATIPSLPEAGDWDAFNAMRLGLAPRLSQQHAASRYATAAS